MLMIMKELIAADNPSYKLFLKNGFEIEYRNEDVVMVKRHFRFLIIDDNRLVSGELGDYFCARMFVDTAQLWYTSGCIM